MPKCGLAAVLAAVLAGLAGLPAAASAQSDAYSPARTPAGHPDLQGIWGNNSVTPLERPDAVADRAMLTDEELARVEATANVLFAQDAGDAAFGDQFFNVALDRGRELHLVRRRDRQLQPVLAGGAGVQQPDVARSSIPRAAGCRRQRWRPRRRRSWRGSRADARRRGPWTAASASGASRSGCRTCWRATTATTRSSRPPTTWSSSRS